MRITRRRRSRLSALAVAAAGLTVMASPAVAATSGPHDLVPYGQLDCRSGPIEPGVYISILVIGSCWLTDFGTVEINGDFRVAHDAKFNGATNGTFIDDGNFYAGTNAIVTLGCNVKSVGPPCTTNTPDVIKGLAYVDNALEMSAHSVTVDGNYVMVGEKDYSNNVDCSQLDLTGTPDYFTFEDGSVGGNFTYLGNHTCWMGLFRSHIKGTVSVSANLTNTTIPGIAFDSPEIASNVIGGKLSCFNNFPAPTFGDSHGKPNIAKGGKTGQCRKL